MGWKLWTRERLSLPDLQEHIQDQVVARFTSASARNTAIPLSERTEGMLTFREELDGVWEAWDEAAAGWKIVGMRRPPSIRGTLRRSDGSNTLNGPNNFTGLETVPVAGTVGTWTTFTDPNGLGRSCSVPGTYLVSAHVQSDMVGPRTEEMFLLGTLPTILGTGSAPGGAGGTFGGSGGAVPVVAPNGLSFAFRYANYSATVAGSIRGSRFSAVWAGPA